MMFNLLMLDYWYWYYKYLLDIYLHKVVLFLVGNNNQELSLT